MRGTAYDNPTDWLEFDDPSDEDQAWRVHVNFLMSNWRCLFGDGCPGHFGVQEAHTRPDVGCCSHGVWVEGDVEQVKERFARLTPEDMSPEGWAYIRKHGWLNVYKGDLDNPDPETFSAKTKVRDGGCVFALRANEGDGRIGCAFHHMGLRTGQPDHIDTMPDACWQAPIGSQSIDSDNGVRISTIEPWDADYWGGADEDGTHDSWMAWWCVDTPDAYSGGERLYVTYEKELRKMMGDGAYVEMARLLKEREHNYVSPMAGAVRNEGRPMLPLIVGNRTPKNIPRGA